MKEWEKELHRYRLMPAPPKENALQKYILHYLAEQDDKYISWFLHYYERTVNERLWLLFRTMQCTVTFLI